MVDYLPSTTECSLAGNTNYAIEKLSFKKWIQFVKEDLDAAHLSIREPWDIQVQLPGTVVSETVFQSDRGFRVAVAKYLSAGPSSSTIIFEIREVEQGMTYNAC
jgi:hypothetical protein